jgi:CubicO group peptidase (beta-lactamase class C family)
MLLSIACVSTVGTGLAAGLGQRVAANAEVEVRARAGTSATLVGRQPPGKLGQVVGGPTTVSGVRWWRVDFEGGADGWVPGTQLGQPYFPPAEARGGWRALTPYNGTPSAAQKAALRARAGVDWDRLKAASDYSRGFASDSAVLVIRNGYVAGEWGSRSAAGVASVTKSLTGLAVAKLFELSDRGLLPRRIGPDVAAHTLLPPEWSAGAPDKTAILIRHLMTMTSGLRPHDQPGASDYLSLIMRLPAEASPGQLWAYASAPVDLLGIAAERAAGATLADVFNREIATKIGAAPFTWGSFGPHTGASSRARTTPRDLARIGYLMLMDGRWGTDTGQTVLVRQQHVRALRDDCRCASAVYRQTPGSPFLVPVTSPRQYGKLWWSNRTGEALGAAVPRDAYYAHGYREKLLVVVPSLNLVVVRFGSAPDSLPDFRRQFMARVMAALVTPTAF